MTRRSASYGRTGSPRLRAVVGITSIAVTALLVVRAAMASGGATRLALVVGAWAVTLQLLGILRWPLAAGPAAALLGLLAGAALLPAGHRDLAVEMVVLFIGATELSGWAARLRSVVPESAASIGRQLGELGGAVAAGAVVTAALVAAGTEWNGPNGRVALALGLLALVVPLALLTSRRWRRASSAGERET